MIIRLILAALALSLLGGCSSFKHSVYSEACARAGYPEDHPRHEECVTNTAAADRRSALGLGESGEPPSAEAQEAAAAYIAAQPMVQPVRSYAPSSSESTQQRRLCPNGQYVYGATCNLAPDGTYVAGTPRLAPNGSYVGGAGRILLCPNGQYVAGTRCVLNPDGSYRGE